jgi:hypothetical protein
LVLSPLPLFPTGGGVERYGSSSNEAETAPADLVTHPSTSPIRERLSNKPLLDRMGSLLFGAVTHVNLHDAPAAIGFLKLRPEPSVTGVPE